MGGFLCEWSFFLAARSGAIAVVAVGFSIYLSYFIPEASATAQLTMGHVGAVLVSLIVLISMFGTTNGHIMTASRLYFAQARDGLFFDKFG